MFHVKQSGGAARPFYRPRSRSSMLMSLGDMPGILDACPTVTGFIFSSFMRASVDSAVILE